ncbi:TniQ family protein [Salinarimonas soli]|nr:TniQ family protein [Salinarimonas soli]
MRTFTDLKGRDEPPLPTWDAPKLGEPAHGFVTRLCWLARRSSVAALLTGHGLGGRDIKPSECLEFAFSFPIREKDALLAATPIVEANRVAFLGQAVRRRQWQISQRRFCPACLAENPYHRVWWDLPAFARCPYHELDIACTDAGGLALPWWSPSFSHSPTGKPLQRFGVPHRTPPVPSLEAYILSRFGIEARAQVPLLDGLPFLGDVLDMVELVGRVALGGASRRRPVVNQTNGFDRARVLRAGYDIVAKGEDALVALLHRVAGERAAGGGGRGKTLFGWIEQAISEEDGEHVPPLRRAMLQVVIERGDFSPATGGEWTNGAAGWVPVPTLARELGLTDERLRRISETLGIHERQFGSARSRYRAFTPDQADFVRTTLSSLLDRTGAAEFLGVSRCTVGAFLSSGELKLFAVIGKDEARDRFRPEDLLAFQSGIMAGTRIISEAPPGFKPLSQVRRTCKTNPAALVAEELQRPDGALRVGDRLGDVLVPDPQARKDMAAARAARWVHPGLSRAAAAKMFGDCEAVIDAFVRAGLLKTLPKAGASSRICPASLNGLRERWAPVSIYKGFLGVALGANVGKCLSSRGVRVLEQALLPRSVAVERASARAVLGIDRDPDDPATGSVIAFETALLQALIPELSWSLAGRSSGLRLRTSKAEIVVLVAADLDQGVVDLILAGGRMDRHVDPVCRVPAPELQDVRGWPALTKRIVAELRQLRSSYKVRTSFPSENRAGPP